MVRRRSAKPLYVGSNPTAASFYIYAGVVELADTRDLKSLGAKTPCRFESGLRHNFKLLDYSAFWKCEVDRGTFSGFALRFNFPSV